MSHFPKPFFKKKRNSWYVEINRKQINLGPDRDAAWKRYHELMANPPDRDEQKSDGQSPLVCTVLDEFLDWLHHRVQDGTRAQRTFDWYKKYSQSFLEAIPKHLRVDAPQTAPCLPMGRQQAKLDHW